MDVLHEQGIRSILWLQSTFGSYTNEMLFMSRVGDPGSIALYFPMAFSFDKALGLLVLWAAVISEWTNLVLKWVLRGERPYWWVNETDGFKHVRLHQYPLTCETGPGSPSGHAMVTSAVFCTVLLFTTKLMQKRLKNNAVLSRLTCCVAWLCFFAILSLISISRVFIATHFPHQVISGVIVGIAIAYSIQKHANAFVQMNFKKCTLVSLFLIIFTLIIYEALSYAIFDPSESVLKAQKWCVEPSYIHIETRPFYALVRDAGAAFGIGIAQWLCFTSGVYNYNTTKNKLQSMTEIVLSLIFIFILKDFKVAFTSDVMSYGFGYLKSVCLVVIVIFCVPAVVAFVRKFFKADVKVN